MKTIRDHILNSMMTDDSFTHADNSRLIKRFNSLTPSEKDAVNDIFISLTGFSFESYTTLDSESKSSQTQKKFSDNHINLGF